ncbi:MAG: autotransporter-associated beta strand repeat-containing protein [Luteolibacter sp.]
MKYYNSLLCPAALVLLGNQAIAAPFYWDNNGATTGFGTATGTWTVPTTGDATQGWSSDPLGLTEPTDITTAHGDTAHFGTDTDGLGSGTITIDGTVAVTDVRFGKASGAITLSGGTISFVDGGTSSFQAATGGGAASSTHTIDSDISKVTGTLRFGTQGTSDENYIVNGIISGGIGLDIREKNNSAYLELNGVNTFTGNVNLVTGQVNVNTFADGGVASSLGTGSIINMGGGGGQTPLIWYTGSTATSTNRSIRSKSTNDNRIVAQDGALELTGTLSTVNTGTYNHNFSGTADTGMNKVSGEITDGSGTIQVAVKSTTPIGGSAEAGTWEFSGNNTYTGITLVTGNSTLIASSAAALGATDSGTTVDSGSVLDVQADIGTEALSITGSGLGGNGALITSTGTGTVGGAVTLTGGSTIGGAGNLNVSGAIDGGFALTKVGSGTATLSGANTYTGSTSIAEGFIQADVADVAATSGALGNGGDISFTGGTLQYTANSAGTDYSGRISNSTSAMTFDTNGQDVTFASDLASSNVGGLIKEGAGTLVAKWANGDYTGLTVVNGGTLQFLKDSGGNAWGAGDFEINNGSRLEINAAATAVFQNRTFTFDSAGGGTIDIDGNTILQTENNTIVTSGGSKNFVTGDRFNMQNANKINYNVADGVDAVDLEVSARHDRGSIGKTGDGTLSLTDTTNNLLITNTITVTAGTLEIGGAGRINNGSSGSAISNDGTFKYSSSASQELSGIISGSGGIIQDNGTLTLSGSNTYTGDTTVSAGTLFANGSLDTSGVSVADGATFGGTGSIAGTLDFGGASTFNIVDIDTALAVTGNVTFGSGFGLDNLTGWDFQNADADTYTLISGSLIDFTNLDNVGLANALTLGNGNKAYFQNGSLQVVIIPEPSVALISALGMLALFRRRR